MLLTIAILIALGMTFGVKNRRIAFNWACFLLYILAFSCLIFGWLYLTHASGLDLAKQYDVSGGLKVQEVLQIGDKCSTGQRLDQIAKNLLNRDQKLFKNAPKNLLDLNQGKLVEGVKMIIVNKISDLIRYNSHFLRTLS